MPQLRFAHSTEAGELTELAMRSKAHWGYDEAFMASCRADLTLTPAAVTTHRTVVAEHDGTLLGFATLEGEAPLGALGMLFVDPTAIGQGIGGLLYRHTVTTARTLGFTHLTIDADPNAAAFYTAMGATLVGETPSTAIPGRVLPLFAVTL